jgi:hypothetical protein
LAKHGRVAFLSRVIEPTQNRYHFGRALAVFWWNYPAKLNGQLECAMGWAHPAPCEILPIIAGAI